MFTIIHFLLHPAWLGVLLLALWIFFLYRQKKKATWIYGSLLAVWIIAVYISPFPIELVENKEMKYAPLDLTPLDTSRHYQILVLGAGKTSDPGLPSTSQLGRTVTQRLIEALRIYHHLPHSTIIGSASATNSHTSQAQTVTEAALSLDVIPSDTAWLPQPHNTQEEAMYFSKRFSTGDPLILVTSAMHMPRAMYWFRQHDTEPIPAPCDFRVKTDPDFPRSRWQFSWGKIELLDLWVHETLGMWYAKMQGSPPPASAGLSVN